MQEVENTFWGGGCGDEAAGLPSFSSSRSVAPPTNSSSRSSHQDMSGLPSGYDTAVPHTVLTIRSEHITIGDLDPTTAHEKSASLTPPFGVSPSPLPPPNTSPQNTYRRIWRASEWSRELERSSSQRKWGESFARQAQRRTGGSTNFSRG